MKVLNVIGLIFLTMTFASCEENSFVQDEAALNALEPLTTQEQQDLQFNYEEEKLAHDVYVYAYELYGLNIFNNISQSESRHMDAIAGLMEKYDLPLNFPEEAGIFSNDTLQQLYNTLIAKVELSLLDALEVGATIEDVDIFDLRQMISRTEKTDILEVYEKLVCGSGNHMRAFYGQLESRGGNYEAQYLTATALQEILNAGHESCGH